MNALLDPAKAPALDRALRLPEVMHRTGLSRSTLYRRMAAGTFPRPISLGGQAVGWSEHRINAWLTTRPAVRP